VNGVGNGQITSLLSNRDLDRLARLRLNASRRFTNRARGEHFASKGGTSTEFCDYRDYAPGDDVRFVDWNIFARIEKPYLKQFHHEEELHVAIIVDGSNSMLFEDKYVLARRVATALGVVGLRGHEKVSVTVVGNGGAQRLQPTSGRTSMRKLFAFMEGLESGGERAFDRGIETFLRRHHGRGVAILLSDFLSAEDFQRPFNLLNSAGLEIFALQILGPTELSPELNGDLRFVDSETQATLDITSAGDLLALYQEYREGHAGRLAELCRQRNGRFLTVSTAEPFETLTFDTLRRRGWVV
jgi:uncharacterized protein (DUF58 family)